MLGPYEMGLGVITVFVRYEGDGPFSLTSVNEDQGEMRSIESRPGPYNGEQVHSVFEGNVGGLAPGNYHVDIEATGPWRVRLFQDRASQRSTARDRIDGQRRRRRQLNRG